MKTLLTWLVLAPALFAGCGYDPILGIITCPPAAAGSGSGTVTEVQAGTGITVTGTATVDPTVSSDSTIIPTFTSDTADASGNCSLGTLWIRTDNGKTWWCTTTNTWTRVADLDANGRIVAAMMPALTGDVTTSAGAVATSVVKIQGRAMAATAPTDGQAIVWDNANSTWEPGTVSGSSLGMFGHVVVSAVAGSSTIVYSPWGYATGQSEANEVRVAMLVPASCTVRNLRVKMSVAQPAGGSLTATVRVNGSDSAVTCSVASTATTCEDLSNTASITAGQSLSLKYVNASGSATTYVSTSFQCN